MAEKFELFRISLTDRSQQPDLFKNPRESREDFLRRIFGGKLVFNHYGSIYHYVVSDINYAGKIVAKVGKMYATLENSSPEEGFAPAFHEGWKASVIVIDPIHHSDGQKISFLHDRVVGKPSSLLRSLTKHINSLVDNSYHIEIEPIFSPNSFWEFAERNRGAITSLTFEFVTPNMFGTTDEVSVELKSFRDIEKAQKVVISVKSEDGIQTNTQKIENSVEYVTQGTGSIKAQAKGGKRYNSKTKTEYSTLPLSEIDENKSIIERVKSNIGRLLGHDR